LTPPAGLAESVTETGSGSGVSGAIAGEDIPPYNQNEIVYMECPFCRHDIAATWQALTAHTDELGRQLTQFPSQINTQVAREKNSAPVYVNVHWLKCQNCQEIVVRILRAESGVTNSWIALPKNANLPAVHPLVTDPFRKDYLEAWTILEDSPRMSAVLSRRLLADLLEKYAGLNQWSLAQRIDAFVADTRHPQWLRQNLHYVREAGDFGAHKQEDKTLSATTAPPEPTIIEVSKEEAKWTLKNIADLFEYFIVGPEKDKEMRAALDKKISDAKRKAIAPLTS
jgi:hypothetical protein